MNEYLKVGDWVQIKRDGPWTRIISLETSDQNARDSNDILVSIYSVHKILRKGSVYIQEDYLGDYVLLFERMEDTLSCGSIILPVVSDLRDNVEFREGTATPSKLELAEDQEYWLSCFAAEEILTTDKYEMACEMLNIKDCLLYTSPSPRDRTRSRMPSSA